MKVLFYRLGNRTLEMVVLEGKKCKEMGVLFERDGNPYQNSESIDSPFFQINYSLDTVLDTLSTILGIQ